MFTSMIEQFKSTDLEFRHLRPFPHLHRYGMSDVMHGICVTCSLSCCCKCAIQQIDCAAQRSEIMSAGHVQVRFNDSEHF